MSELRRKKEYIRDAAVSSPGKDGWTVYDGMEDTDIELVNGDEEIT